eukprot:TRINITY_DN2860_c0_g2_i1.p1 TRINITY_DN2860_c0_g2~~TRINITY_DN2860_c0_g2_i1.p1  ORF type:complete len:1449 (+),score=407.52 TRINITY_DN2860_c0_g2_i1:118-4347(+)
MANSSPVSESLRGIALADGGTPGRAQSGGGLTRGTPSESRGQSSVIEQCSPLHSSTGGDVGLGRLHLPSLSDMQGVPELPASVHQGCPLPSNSTGLIRSVPSSPASHSPRQRGRWRCCHLRRLGAEVRSIRTIYTAISVLLVTITAVTSITSGAISMRHVLDSTQETQEQAVATCFDTATASIANISSQMMDLLEIGVFGRAASLFSQIEDSVWALHTAVRGSGAATSHAWVEQVLVPMTRSIVLASVPEITACGFFGSWNSMVVTWELDATVGRPADEPHSHMIIAGDSSGGYISPLGPDGAVQLPIDYNVSELPDIEGFRNMGYRCGGWCSIIGFQEYTGIFYAVPYTPAPFGEHASPRATVLCGIDSRAPSLFFRQLSALIPGSLIYAVERGTGTLAAVSDNSSVGRLVGPLEMQPLPAAESPTLLVNESWAYISAAGVGSELFSGSTPITLKAGRYFIRVSDQPISKGMDWILVIMLDYVITRGALDESQLRTERYLTHRFERTRGDAQDDTRLTIIIVAAIALLLMAAGSLFARAVARPFRLLRDDMLLVAQMELEELGTGQRMPCISEVEAMSTSFHQMICNLREYRAFLPEGVMETQDDVSAGREQTLDDLDAVEAAEPSAWRLSQAPSGSSTEKRLRAHATVSPVITESTLPQRNQGKASVLGSSPADSPHMSTLGHGLFGDASLLASVRSDAGPPAARPTPRMLGRLSTASTAHNPFSGRHSVRSDAGRDETHESSSPDSPDRRTDKAAVRLRQLQEKSQGMRQRKASLVLARHETQGPHDAAVAFFTSAMNSVKAHEGIVMGLWGQSMLAGWNVFVTNPPQHAKDACSCAIEIARTRGPPVLGHTHVAVTHGYAWYGYVAGASTDHRKPLVIGAPMSQLAEVRSLAELLAVDVTCTQRCWEQARWCLRGRAIDTISASSTGTAAAASATVNVYEILGTETQTDVSPPASPSGDRLNIPQWNDAYSCFREHDWAVARESFHQMLLDRPDDYQACRLLRLAIYFEAAGRSDASGASPPKPYCRAREANGGWEDWESSAQEVPLPEGCPDPQPAAGRRLKLPVARRSSAAEHERLLREIRDFRALRGVDSAGQLRSVHSTGKDPRSPTAPQVQKRGQVVTDRRGHKWRKSEKMLGKGAFGEVWLGMGEDGVLVAMKCLRLPTAAEQPAGHRSRRAAASKESIERQIKELVQEVSLLSQLRHENIVAYLSSVLDSGLIWICTEYLPGGSLNDVCDHFGAIGEAQLKRYIRDVLEGLRYLHDKGVIHRDIKPHNVLMQIDGLCKLTDFGASALVASASGQPSGPIGTPVYMAPEACAGKAEAPADIWGIGIMFLQLATGRLPWEQEGAFIPMQFIYALANDPHKVPVVSEAISPEARRFVMRCLVRDAEQRSTACDLLGDRFLM